MPVRSGAPGRMLCSSRSARDASLPMISWPSAVLRSRQMHSEPPMVRCTDMGMPCRPQSPPGASMRITRAPSSATRAQPSGPLITVPKSRRVMPSRACLGMGAFLPLERPASTFRSRASTSAVCWPSAGAGPCVRPGVPLIFTTGPSWRVSPTPGTCTLWTLPLCRICGWSSARSEVKYGSAATLPASPRNMSIHSSSVFSCTFSSMMRSRAATAS